MRGSSNSHTIQLVEVPIQGLDAAVMKNTNYDLSFITCFGYNALIVRYESEEAARSESCSEDRHGEYILNGGGKSHGDSITQCSNEPNGLSFASAVQNAYARKLDIINRGFSGYNTNHALEVLPQIFPIPEQAKICFLLIFFGANDLNRGPSTNQHVPLPQFVEYLKKIIYPPVDESTCRDTNAGWGNLDEPRWVKDTREYRDALIKIGEEGGLRVVDIWSAFMNACGWKEDDDLALMPGLEENGKHEELRKLLYDGLHFSGEGYKILFEAVTKCIAEKLPSHTSKPDNIDNVVKMQWENYLGW
ncbi:hypothetical protein SBOR_3812 [Sclerotinia borealis F-4128]|uniref:SGNH hydrolase-type esterase domain-containing protein n=1 Tax=Sclerotinia borealis (strain F-4128) TaxID=1432307 RepID=W9CMT1_SCLBF|nr:hypothetical protein SBOR_3812 [Sclerotinia borealis F-4128]